MLTKMEKLLFIMLSSKVILMYIAIVHLCGLLVVYRVSSSNESFEGKREK